MSRSNGKPNPLMEKAQKLANVDFEINGGFHNAPYNLTDGNGDHFKAYVRMHHEHGGQRAVIEIVRPAVVITTATLWDRPADVPPKLADTLTDEQTPW